MAHAAEVYGGIGFPGMALGFVTELADNVGLRAEAAGGWKLSRNGQREGLSYDGSLTNNRIGAFIDWFPFSNNFRLTGGLTANDAKISLNGRGSNGNINGKPVDLTNETFNLSIKYPGATTFVGLGWGHRPRGQVGLGLFADVGVQIGRFKTDTVQTTVVGKYGITQADVDAEVSKVNDNLGKLSVLPSASLGMTYKF